MVNCDTRLSLLLLLLLLLQQLQVEAEDSTPLHRGLFFDKRHGVGAQLRRAPPSADRGGGVGEGNVSPINTGLPSTPPPPRSQSQSQSQSQSNSQSQIMKAQPHDSQQLTGGPRIGLDTRGARTDVGRRERERVHSNNNSPLTAGVVRVCLALPLPLYLAAFLYTSTHISASLSSCLSRSLSPSH